MIVVEISGAVDESGTVRKWLFGDRGWATGPGDIPANTEVSGDLLDPGYLGVQAFDQNKFGGGTKLEIGEVIIANTDGALDEFINYGFDGRAVYIRQGEPGDLYPGQFSTILTATVDGKPECSFEEVVFRLRDKSWLFEAQVLNERYAGTNAGPTGIEGGPDDIKDTVKPWLLGKATYFSPPCVNTSTLTFQVSKRRIQSIQAVYDGGLPLVFDIDYQRSSLLNAVTIAAGSYATCLAEGLFRLGGAPEGEVTCDATEGDLPANRTVAQILRTLALEAGVTEQEVYEPDLTALDLKNSAVVGVWINDEDSFLAYMDRVAISAGAAYYFDRLGMFRMGRLELPTGLDAVGTLTNADVSEINLATNGLQGLPVSAVKVNYSLYYTTQTDPLGAVTTQRRAEIAQAYRSSVKEDASVKLQFIQAPTLEVDTLLTSRADAEAESQRMLTLFRRPRHYFEVTITQDEFASIPNLGLFSAVLLQMPRFGMDETAAFLVTGLRLRLGEAKADLTLWGGGPGVVYMEMTGRAVAYIAAEAVLGIVEQSVSLSVDMPADIAVAALAPEVTVPWWDATAKAHLNFELQEVRLYGVAATWSDYIDETGAATATLRAMLPGFATSGVAVWKAKDAPLDGYRGLWGYVGGAGSEGRNAVGWWGNGATTQTAGIKPGGTDVTTPIPDSAADDDPFAVGVSWAAAGAKVCGSNAGAVASTATAFPAKTVDEAYLWNDGYGDVPFNGTRQHLLVFDPQDIGGSAGALVSDAVLQAKTITVVGLLPTTNQVPATNITLAALAPTVEASAGWSVLFRDDSTKPLSLRRGVAQTINGQAVGPFAYGAMVAADARGSYSTFEWTDGWGMADPHQVGSRRDDQTYMFNPIGAGPFAAGHCNITRDTAAGTTTLRMRRKSGLPNASGLTPHAYEARVDGSMTSAELNMLHSLSGPPPYEIVIEGIDDPQGVQEAWTAFWTRQADSHQSATNYTQEVIGAHTEQDFWERTGLLAWTHNIFINHIYDVGGGVLQGFGGGYTPDMGGVIGESLWDTRIVVTETTTFNYIRPHTSPEADWTLYFQWDHAAASRFSSAPVYLQIDAKAGYRWSDRPDWVKSIDGSTPDYDLTWKSVTVSVPSSNVANWTNTTIDPDDIPDMAPTWDVDPASWDNSVATATVLATFTTNTGFSYQVHGLTGIAFVGDQIQTTGLMPAGTREIVVWAERDSDAAVFLVGVYEVTVADNAVWYDADAKVHLNFQSQQVREYGVAGTWSDYIDGNGEATATLRAMMPGYASAGVAVWYGSGAPSSGWKGLWGYPSLNTTGMYAVEWIGNGAAAQQAAIKTSENIDRLATVAGTDANADAFTIGVSWAVAGAKVCGNAGDVTASGAAFEANNGAAGKLWNNGYGDRTFDGTRQFIALYDPEDIGGAAGALVSDAILQGKCGVYVPPTPPPSEWDDTAKVHLNFETSEVREYGVAGTWSDYIDGGGNATALLRGLLMGYASSGVAVWKGTGGGNGYHSLWGYPSATNTGNNCVQWVGNGTSAQSAIVKTSENVDHTATIANTDTDADPFALGVSWSASAAKVCGNGGSCASSANGFEANSGTDALLWNGYYGDRAFDGTKQQLLIFAPEDIGGSAGAVVSDAILQGKAVAL